MNANRDYIKGKMIDLWPSSKLTPQVINALITRIEDARLECDQVDAMLTAHRMECDRASYSPFAPDLVNRISRLRTREIATRAVATTSEEVSDESNWTRWAAWANQYRAERVIKAVSGMTPAEIVQKIEQSLPEVVLHPDFRFVADVWAHAKNLLGKPDTWTVRRMAECQPSRLVMCRVFNVQTDAPKFDPGRQYPKTNKRVFDNKAPF